MWQFAQAVTGLADGCQTLGIPVTGGNVSLYNQTGTTPILPTPVVGVLGVIEDVRTRTPGGFSQVEDSVWLLGDTHDELAGSAWADVVHGHLGGLPPRVDLAHEMRLASIFVTAAAEGLLSSAHDLADGGAAQALVESCLRRGHGVRVSVPEGLDPFVFLFSESAGRVLVSLPAERESRLKELAAEVGVPLTKLGAVGDVEDATVTVDGQLSLDLAAIRAAWSAPMPTVLAH